MMNRRKFSGHIGISTSAILLNARAGQVAGAEGKRPNLVFVFPDQMRGQAMGFLDEEPVITPTLDRFATESLVLPQTISNFPICGPFRAMLMTGKYPFSNKVTANPNSASAPYGCELQQSDRCWSDVLKDKGYSLGYIGKWHLDSPHEPYIKCKNNTAKLAQNEWCPPERRHGFDFWYSYGTYDYHNRPMYWDTDADRQGFHFVDQWGPEHETDLAVKYIGNEGGQYRDPDKPFALVVSMNPPHTPYEFVPQRYVDMYKDKTLEDLVVRPNIPPADAKWGKCYRDSIRNYFAMITGVDDQFGRILKALKQQGLDENTIVVFTSDHGNCVGIHNMITKNNRFEESLRIPFLIRWPNKIKPRQDDLLFSGLDMYPTLLDLMGFSQDIPQDVDGVSYASLFLKEQGARPDWQWYMRSGGYGKAAWGQRGIRNHQYTFVVDKEEGEPDKTYLHDRQRDPYQLRNVVKEYPELARQLTSQLEITLKKYNDPWVGR